MQQNTVEQEHGGGTPRWQPHNSSKNLSQPWTSCTQRWTHARTSSSSSQPASHNKVQSMLRHMLATEGVPPETTNHITMHSLLLWAAKMDYQAIAARDLRKYIRHWSKEETADAYKREHSKIVTKISDTIWANYGTATDTARAEVPDQLDDAEYLGVCKTETTSAISNAAWTARRPPRAHMPHAYLPRPRATRHATPKTPPIPAHDSPKRTEMGGAPLNAKPRCAHRPHWHPALSHRRSKRRKQGANVGKPAHPHCRPRRPPP